MASERSYYLLRQGLRPVEARGLDDGPAQAWVFLGKQPFKECCAGLLKQTGLDKVQNSGANPFIARISVTQLLVNDRRGFDASEC